MSDLDWYDHAHYYDVLFGWDPTTERDFVVGASERYGLGTPARSLEPMCGTGRLLRAMPGLAVGFDLSPAMVRYAARRGGPGVRVFRADAARFALAEAAFDAAYCLIDSVRHLLTEEAMLGHLRAVARTLRPGAVYVLGLDVTGGLEPGPASREDWVMERGGVRVAGVVEGQGDVDRARRLESMRVELDVRDGGRRRRLESRQPLRTYTPGELEATIATEGSFELAACCDRAYGLERTRPLDRVQGSAVLVLRRRDAPGRRRRAPGLSPEAP